MSDLSDAVDAVKKRHDARSWVIKAAAHLSEYDAATYVLTFASAAGLVLAGSEDGILYDPTVASFVLTAELLGSLTDITGRALLPTLDAEPAALCPVDKRSTKEELSRFNDFLKTLARNTASAWVSCLTRESISVPVSCVLLLGALVTIDGEVRRDEVKEDATAAERAAGVTRQG